MLPDVRAVLASVVFALSGVLVGAGGYTFYYARGVSYLSDDPQACVNCHVMRESLASWERSSHHRVAACNDCHMPHDFVGKYLTKLQSGVQHARAFTFQDWHEPIRIQEANKRVVLENCRTCHQSISNQLPEHMADPAAPVNCITCHRSAGHAGR